MTSKVVYSNQRWLVALAAGVAILSTYVNMIVYAPILSFVAKDLSVDMGQATGLMMGFVLAVAFALILGGVVCDKFGIATALVLGLLCVSMPAVLMPFVGKTFQVVFLLRLIQGASIGFVLGTVGPIVALWFPPNERGLAGGILFGCIGLGSTIGVIASPVVLASTGSWQTTVAVLSIFGWIGIVLALLFTRQTPPVPASPEQPSAKSESPSQKQRVGFLQALTFPMTWVGSLTVAANSWCMYCLFNLVPAYLSAEAPMGLGLSGVTAGQLSTALTAVGIIGPLIGGLFFDKLAKGDHRIAVAVGFVVTGAFTYLILVPSVYQNFGLLVVCLMLAGWGISFGAPSLSAFIATNYPPSIVGRMIGWWFGFGTFGGALGLTVGGLKISKSGSFYGAIAMISFASLVGLILIFCLKRRQV